jgi:hypothetical protein
VSLPPSPVGLSSHHHFYKLSHSWFLGMCRHSCLLWSAYLFTVHVGSGPSTISCGVFFPLPLLQAFPLLVAGRVPPLLPSPASLFIDLQFHEGLPLHHSSVLRVPHPLYYLTFLLLLLITQFFFSFFPGWGSVCPGGYADLAQGCLTEYHVLLSSPCGLCLPKRSGHWHLSAQEPSCFLHLM